MIKQTIDFLYNLLKQFEEKVTPGIYYIKGMRRSIQIDHYSCAAQMVNSILNYYNRPSSFNKILANLETSVEDGTDTPNIIRLLLGKGFRVDIKTYAEASDIKSALKFGHPVIITVNDWEHWLAVYGYGKEKFLLIDSNYKRLSVSVTECEFLELWDDNWIAVVKD